MGEIHAGDALWFLHAGLRYFEEHQAPPAVIEHLRNCARIVGAHIGVPEPMDADADGLIRQLVQMSGQQPQEPPQQRSGGNSYSDPDRIEHAKTMLDAMVSSDLFEWADMVEDIHQKMHGESPFITDKMFRALVNIAKKGKYNDDSMFWDEFQGEFEATADFAQDCADRA